MKGIIDQIKTYSEGRNNLMILEGIITLEILERT
jgi:hypothetical protein